MVNKKYIKAISPLLFTMLVTLFTGCAKPPAYKYKNDIMMVKPIISYGQHFSDKNIHIRFNIDEKRLNFSLKNRSKNPIEILWKDVSFVNEAGENTPVAGKHILFSKKMTNGTVPAPTMIEPGEDISDFIIPIANVEKWEEWSWYVKPMFKLTDDTALDYKGKGFTLAMPIAINGKTKRYKFEFKIYHVTPRKHSSSS